MLRLCAGLPPKLRSCAGLLPLMATHFLLPLMPLLLAHAHLSESGITW